MAVTKIKKIASWIQIVIILATLGVLGVFYFGGEVEDSVYDTREPIYTDLLIYWLYVVFALSIIGLLIFAVHQFVTSLIARPKSALASLGVIVAFLALLGITYSMGSATPVTVSQDFDKFNVPFWLKVTDMWIFTMVTLFVLCILAVAAGQLGKVFNK